MVQLQNCTVETPTTGASACVGSFEACLKLHDDLSRRTFVQQENQNSRLLPVHKAAFLDNKQLHCTSLLLDPL